MENKNKILFIIFDLIFLSLFAFDLKSLLIIPISIPIFGVFFVLMNLFSSGNHILNIERLFNKIRPILRYLIYSIVLLERSNLGINLNEINIYNDANHFLEKNLIFIAIPSFLICLIFSLDAYSIVVDVRDKIGKFAYTVSLYWVYTLLIIVPFCYFDLFNKGLFSSENIFTFGLVILLLVTIDDEKRKGDKFLLRQDYNKIIFFFILIIPMVYWFTSNL